jgi:hypothetical protein
VHTNGTYHIENVRIASPKGLLGNIEEPRVKGATGLFRKALEVQAEQGGKGEHDLHEHGEKVILVVNHADLVAIRVVAVVVVIRHGRSLLVVGSS